MFAVSTLEKDSAAQDPAACDLAVVVVDSFLEQVICDDTDVSVAVVCRVSP